MVGVEGEEGRVSRGEIEPEAKLYERGWRNRVMWEWRGMVHSQWRDKLTEQRKVWWRTTYGCCPAILPACRCLLLPSHPNSPSGQPTSLAICTSGEVIYDIVGTHKHVKTLWFSFVLKIMEHARAHTHTHTHTLKHTNACTHTNTHTHTHTQSNQTGLTKID